MTWVDKLFEKKEWIGSQEYHDRKEVIVLDDLVLAVLGKHKEIEKYMEEEYPLGEVHIPAERTAILNYYKARAFRELVSKAGEVKKNGL